MQEITKFWVFIPFRKANLKDFKKISDKLENLIPYATRLLLKYEPNSCFKINGCNRTGIFPILYSRHRWFYLVCHSYYGSPLRTAVSITVAHYSPVTIGIILWTAISPQMYSHLHLIELFCHCRFLKTFLLKWQKRNIIMRDSCGSSGMKSLHSVFNTWENWWLKETSHLQMLPFVK